MRLAGLEIGAGVHQRKQDATDIQLGIDVRFASRSISLQQYGSIPLDQASLELVPG